MLNKTIEGGGGIKGEWNGGKERGGGLEGDGRMTAGKEASCSPSSGYAGCLLSTQIFLDISRKREIFL